ncbi:unnamed protein product [Clonostachys rhizophaga]|uniref:Clr5 domain-containing protein n=1 Tax=Clonostachys rhizophaga TaxID=160324 RepID=A0A9N9V5A4_9HYPO|nr:unnamed protein product [Clonostachys rhizophaga]
MPTILQKISKEKWEEYKPIIKRLHMDQGLPVKSRIGRPNLTQVMKDDHNFEATHSQYEAQLKRWGWVKNLSKEEWNLVLPLYHWLKEQQMDVRVKVSGRPLEKARLERGRRYVNTKFDGGLVPPLTGWLSMSDHRHITIETREANREWSQYPPWDDTGDLPGTGFNSDVNLLIDEAMLQDITPQENVMGFENGTLGQATLNGSETAGAIPDSMVNSWFRTRETPVDNIIGPQFNDNCTMTQPSNNYQMSSRMDLILKPPSIDLVSHRLVELVQEIESQSDLFGMTFGANSLPCAILYSIANGFTGLSEIPASSVVKLLKNEPHVYATMHKLLLDAPAIVAKPFAENLLKASVEAADAEAVRVIARTMMQRGIKINPNELMCECDGRFLTPAELAGKFRSVDLLQVLLKLGADANKTSDGLLRRINGALNWALDVKHLNGVILEGEIEPSFALVQMLVDAGAIVQLDSLLLSVKWCRDSRILALVIQKITDDEDGRLLRFLPDLIKNMDNDLGIQATQKLFEVWDSRQLDCLNCGYPKDKGIFLQRSLDEAILRENLDLCQLILSRAVPGAKALPLAIGKGNCRIASLLIQHGARVSEGAGEPGEQSRGTGGFFYPDPLFTPLGEAIRLQDPSMLQWVEEQGAWTFVSDRRSLESVAEAAAEVGNIAVLERLFAMDVVRDRGPSTDFERALEAATRKENIPTVQLLLDNGARPNERILELALDVQNRDLFRMILCSGVVFACCSAKCDRIEYVYGDYSCALELAIKWGNMEIVKELIHAKAHYSMPQQGARGLCAAIRSGNVLLVDLLLSAGVSPDAAYKYRKAPSTMIFHSISPLFTAVKSGNEGMVRHLLQKGADPADALAISLAVELDKTSLFKTLLTAFRQSYPAGRADFGADPLIKAIEKEECPYFEELLEARMNVNHLSLRCGRTPLGSVVERHGTMCLEIAAKLLKSGADPNAIARMETIEGPYRRAATTPPETALLIAIEAENEDMVALLLKNGADVNKAARRGIERTPLQSACQKRSLPIVQLLIERGADVNAPPSIRNGGTALQLACLSGSIRIVRHLLSVGANVFGPTSNANGRSALENAAENGRLDIIKVLWDATGGCGFPAREIAKAQRFARARGFPGCAEYVAKLAEASAEASLLEFLMTTRS